MRFVLLSLIFLFVGCRSAKPAPSREEPSAVPERPERAAPIGEPDKVGDPLPDTPVLAHGNHFVYGLEMPRGMLPMKSGSPMVQRFDGTHGIPALKRFIVAQLVSPVEIRENRMDEGYFISNALVTARAGDQQRLNIKILPGSLGGGAVEVWPAKRREENQLSSGMDTFEADLRRRDKVRVQLGVPERKPSRQTRVKSTFRVIDKISRGEPLTEEDYDSPYFTEM